MVIYVSTNGNKGKFSDRLKKIRRDRMLFKKYGPQALEDENLQDYVVPKKRGVFVDLFLSNKKQDDKSNNINDKTKTSNINVKSSKKKINLGRGYESDGVVSYNNINKIKKQESVDDKNNNLSKETTDNKRYVYRVIDSLDIDGKKYELTEKEKYF